MGGDLQNWRIMGGATGISPAHLVPGTPAGLPGLALHSLGSILASWVLGAWEGGRIGEEEER